MALTKQHFAQTAANIKAVVEETEASWDADSVALFAATSALKDVASQMAAWFAKENPRFDRQRFMVACGL